MATEKAIVNVSQSVVSLSQGRLAPGGIFRVADHFRDSEDVNRDVQLRKYMSSGYIQIQDLDFDALARAKRQIVLDDEDRAAEHAKQADAAMAAQAAQEAGQQKAQLVAEGRAAALQETAQEAQRAQAALPVADDNLDVLFETTRKQRIAAAQKVREQVVEPEQAKPVIDRMVKPSDLTDLVDTKPDTVAAKMAAKSVEPKLLKPADLNDDQLHKVVIAFEVKGARKMKTRAALVQAVEDLQLDPQDLRRIIEEE